MSADVSISKTIAEFKKTRWWLPTVARYKAHLEICRALDCPELIEPFSRFVSEVLSSPEAVRDDMLSMQAPEPFQAAVRYRQYDTPILSEMIYRFASRKK